MNGLIAELKRRNVFRVGIAYLALAWLVVEVTGMAVPALNLSEQLNSIVFYLGLIGFPFALFFAWAYELTPGGLKRDEDVTEEDAVRSATWRGLEHLGFGIVIVALGVVVWDAYLAPPDEAATTPTSETIASDSIGGIDLDAAVPGFSGRSAIAVLPFVNMSGDIEQQYFADGLTEDIITGLQTYRGFPVIARTSTFVYKDAALDIRQIARELGAGYVVQGSVRKVGDRLRITAQLVSGEGLNIWAETYDGSLDGLMAMEDEITARIVNAIEPELLSAETSRVRYVRTEDYEAFDYYLRALAETNFLFGYTDLHGRPVTLARNNRARELALKAIEIDPRFARAFTLLTHIEGEVAHLFRSEVSQEQAAAAIKRAIQYGTIARQLSPFDSTACSCLAFILASIGDVDLAIDIQKLAVEANPSHSNAHAVYAWALSFDGQYKKALKEIELAKRLSPRDMAMSGYLYYEALIHLGLGDLEMAAVRAREATSMSSLNYDARILHILTLDTMGRQDEARAVLVALLENNPDFTIDSLWNTPVADILIANGAVGSSADDRPSFREIVAERLARLGWQGQGGD